MRSSINVHRCLPNYRFYRGALKAQKPPQTSPLSERCIVVRIVPAAFTIVYRRWWGFLGGGKLCNSEINSMANWNLKKTSKIKKQLQLCSFNVQTWNTSWCLHWKRISRLIRATNSTDVESSHIASFSYFPLEHRASPSLSFATHREGISRCKARRELLIIDLNPNAWIMFYT